MEMYLEEFKMKSVIYCIVALIALTSLCTANLWGNDVPQSVSGVQMAKTPVLKIDPSTGLAYGDQSAIWNRIIHDNMPDAIKYLYVLGFNGQVIYHDTVKGKVTSSGKRLNPRTLDTTGNTPGMWVGSDYYHTPELMEADGTFGDSAPYLFYWDTKGNYKQIFLTGSATIIVSDQPETFNQVTLMSEGN